MQSIDTFLQSKGCNVKRDVRDLGRWHSIREFMGTIRRQDYAILIISDQYLRSSNCMYEVGGMLKERDYKDIIIPIVMETSIYDPVKRLEYIKYWENELQKLETAKEQVSMTNRGEATETLKRYKSIAMNMGEFR
ncbi:MAG: toll/interleukin-1 receptor domain-containing protein [Dorea sp.]|nr:toll/interleukin-1 receptor domain-containing protein [Dorea sp.]